VFEGLAVSSRDPNAGASIISTGDPIFWNFLVERQIKGSTGPQQEVGTARGGASCGFTFQIGVRYRVFASRQGGDVPDQPRVGHQAGDGHGSDDDHHRAGHHDHAGAGDHHDGPEGATCGYARPAPPARPHRLTPRGRRADTESPGARRSRPSLFVFTPHRRSV